MDSLLEHRYRIGVDVGGTNTDAVLIALDSMNIITSHKSPTTPDVTTGITNAVRRVIDAANVSLSSISCVIIGTTHFVNAIVQRSESLRRVAVIRLCGGPEDGFGRGIPPFIDFPLDLRACIESSSHYFCHGGYQISGDEISAVDVEEICRIAIKIIEDGIENVVVSGMYAPLNHKQEVAVRDTLLQTLRKQNKPGFKPRITMSHEISGLGFLARENAAILNATLRPLAEKTIYGFRRAMQEIFQGSPYTLYLTQNDGSVLSAEEAIGRPIRTFNSGPTNSIRGGEFLWRAAGKANGKEQQNRTDPLVVIDIGGTTSDSGLLLSNGLPQMSSIAGLVGGVLTNFALPAVESIGLGGGSIVRETDGELTIGPDSVALELLQKAKLFGGEYLTSTDIVAASNIYTPTEHNPFRGMGDPSRLRSITQDTVSRAEEVMRQMIADLVDRTKTQKGDVDVLIVGGGASIIKTDKPLAGVRSLRTVKGAAVANAVGAAISRVSGIIDTVVDTSNQTIKEAQKAVSWAAVEKAVANGAKPDTVNIAEITMLPIQYVEAKARIVVRAVGELAIVSQGVVDADTLDVVEAEEDLSTTKPTNSPRPISVEKPVDFQTYRPVIKDGEWIISPTDLDFISQGCKILGCGGGGDPYQEYLKVSAIVRGNPGTVKVISPSYLPEDALVGWTGCMGSPEVSMERLENDECHKAHEELMRVTGSLAVSGLVALEIGGGNGVVNLGVAARLGVPCIDADYMGRAYPTVWQVTPNVYGTSRGEALVPMTIASGDGSVVTMTTSRTDMLVDKILRASCVEMGCRAGSAGPPKTSKTVREQAITNSVSLAWWIGRAIALEKTIADRAKRIIDELGGPESAAILGEGKITNVERVLKTGHTYGVLEVEGKLEDGTKALLRVPFKNENAFVEAVFSNSDSKILASVPDLIAVLDAETGAGLGTPEYKYGLKVMIIAIAASPRWTDTPRGMALGGPGSMGFEDIEYVPIGKYSKPRSVIDVFAI
ncbi:conserved hypothetical protein [Talaromyces stipitatus ATCC 10500]|uniref:Hydantoinase/oxoprolinase n=1 Tax=Talaromyces stipitatus (strain ATCC 10500 / CBS 375.48 / QM 6759 / NRRL 1006) TaxID=441959 RepID=B8MNM7_TALSN|nr:uncharacterized protein TSTA_103400 [Talaromyces stipitatus ATCC 10500]EED14116.1 conserved hypothetical protein [Talaromyces stipitatus ATCC 10500]